MNKLKLLFHIHFVIVFFLFIYYVIYFSHITLFRVRSYSYVIFILSG